MFRFLASAFNPLFFVAVSAILHIKIAVLSSKCCCHVIRSCVKSFQIWSFFRSKNRKIRTRKPPYLETFCTVRFSLTFYRSSVSVHDSFDIQCSLRVPCGQPIHESAVVCITSMKFDHLTLISFVSSGGANLLRTCN